MTDIQGPASSSKSDVAHESLSRDSSVDNAPTRPGPDNSATAEEYFVEEDMPSSPQRTSLDNESHPPESRDEMLRNAQALHESMLNIFNRIEAVKEEHDKLDSHNKFLQKYIGDLMSTSKITASGSRSKK